MKTSGVFTLVIAISVTALVSSLAMLLVYLNKNTLQPDPKPVTPGSQIQKQSQIPEVFQADPGNVCQASFTLAPLTYSCTGTAPSNATLCTGDDTGLTADTNRTLVDACTTTNRCEYTCSSGFVRSGTTCVAQTYTCTGTPPTNSTLCSGDNTGLTTNTPLTLVDSCTTANRCEYTCSSGYVRSGTSCVAQTYSCTGTAPTNSTLCTGDNTGLTVNTALTLVDSCTTATSCEYTCNTGYVRSGTSCVAQAYSCTGTTPTNSSLCTGDNTGLTANTPLILVDSCTTATRCEFTCNTGYVRSGTSCVAQTYSCTGTTPTNATLCTGDDTGLTANTARTVVSSCNTSAKCEYTCNANYVRSGSTCVAVVTPVPTPTASPEPPKAPELPKAGGIPPTILFTIGGIILVAIGLLF